MGEMLYKSTTEVEGDIMEVWQGNYDEVFVAGQVGRMLSVILKWIFWNKHVQFSRSVQTSLRVIAFS